MRSLPYFTRSLNTARRKAGSEEADGEREEKKDPGGEEETSQRRASQRGQTEVRTLLFTVLLKHLNPHFKSAAGDLAVHKLSSTSHYSLSLLAFRFSLFIFLLVLIKREKANELYQWLWMLEAEKFDFTKTLMRQKYDVSISPRDITCRAMT